MGAVYEMSDGLAAATGFVKCACNNCDIFIEFPAHGVGETITCPHCGMETVLFEPATTPG